LIQANNGLSDKSTCEKWMVMAADLGHIDFIKFFLEKGFSASAKDHMDFYAFYRAVKYPDIFFLLAEHGVDVQAVGYAGTTAIIHAAREGCTEVIQYLLEKGVNPEIKYGNFTAIEVAKEHNKKNSKEVVKLLKSYKKLNPKK
jgi:ankyrin repeat protein